MFQDINDLFRMREQTDADVDGLTVADAALVEKTDKQRRDIEDKIRDLQNEKYKLDRDVEAARRVIADETKTLRENVYNERSYFMRRITMASLKLVTPAAFATKLLDTRYDFEKKPLRVDVLYETVWFSIRAVYFDIAERYGRNRTNTVQLYVSVFASDGLGGYGYNDRGIYGLAGFERNSHYPGGDHNISYDAGRLYDNRFKTLADAAAFVERNKAKWLKDAVPKVDAFGAEVAAAPAFEDVFDFRLLWGSLDSTYYVESATRRQLTLTRTLNWHSKETKKFFVTFDGFAGFVVEADPKDRYRIVRNIADYFDLRHLAPKLSELSRLSDEWEKAEEKKNLEARQAAC